MHQKPRITRNFEESLQHKRQKPINKLEKQKDNCSRNNIESRIKYQNKIITHILICIQNTIKN